MSSERIGFEDLSKRMVDVSQDRWSVVPTFQSLEALGEAQPFFKEGLSTSPSAERQARFKISVSSLEKLIPRFLEDINRTPSLQIDQDKRFSESSTKEGEKLHEADLLYSLVVQGHTGILCEKALPTVKKKELEVYQEATDGIYFSSGAGEKEIYEALTKAWGRYFDLASLEPENLPMPGFGFQDPRKKEEAYYSDRLYVLGQKLAELWAKEATKSGQRMWEFNGSKFTEREVGITVIPVEYPLVINTRLDFISRPRPAIGKVISQVGDLKTSEPWRANDLLGEVLKRQAQLMLIIAERYTVDGLSGSTNPVSKEPNLVLNNKHYLLKRAMFDNMAVIGRSSFFYRIFNKETGDIKRMQIEMDKERRREFINWMNHLVEYMLKDPDTTRRIIKGPNFKLRGVPVSMSGR